MSRSTDIYIVLLLSVERVNEDAVTRFAPRGSEGEH